MSVVLALETASAASLALGPARRLEVGIGPALAVRAAACTSRQFPRGPRYTLPPRRPASLSVSPCPSRVRCRCVWAVGRAPESPVASGGNPPAPGIEGSRMRRNLCPGWPRGTGAVAMTVAGWVHCRGGGSPPSRGNDGVGRAPAAPPHEHEQEHQLPSEVRAA